MTERGEQPGDPRNPSLDELLDRADGAAELQRRAQADPGFSRQLAMQAQLDASLRRQFEAPEVAITLPSSAKPAWTRLVPWGLAAALLLAVLGGWWLWMRPATGPDVLTPLYREVVAAGFKPETVCTDDAEFANWCRGYFRQVISPSSHPAGLELVGWNTTTTIGPVTGVLLARVDGEPVIVVMNRSDRQNVRPPVEARDSLHIFRRRLGDVVLYEVTPKSQETVLPNLAAKAPSR